MDRSAHMLAGCVFGVTAVTTMQVLKGDLGGEEAVTFFGYTLFASALPDIDNKGSGIGRICPFFRSLQGTYDHRSRITHTLVIPVIASVLLMAFRGFGERYYAAFGFFSGYVLHLLCDTFTKDGIMWKYPFSWKHYSLKQKRCGGVTEKFIAGALAGLTALIMGVIGTIIL